MTAYRVRYLDGTEATSTLRPVDGLAFERWRGVSIFDDAAVMRYEDHLRIAWIVSTHSPAYPPHLPRAVSLDDLAAGVGFDEWVGFVDQVDKIVEETENPTNAGPSPA